MRGMRSSSTTVPMHTAATWMATQAARRPADLAASACPGPGGPGQAWGVPRSGVSGKSTTRAARTLRILPSAGWGAGPGCAAPGSADVWVNMPSSPGRGGLATA